MLPLYRDPHFTFRFATDRLVDRFHLDGADSGTRVSVFALDPVTDERLKLITESVVGNDGWVNLTEPLIIRAGHGFVVVVGSPRTAQ